MKHYLSLGYKNIHKGDQLEVPVEYLMKGSQKKIKVICDYCGKEYTPKYNHYLHSHENNSKDACNNGNCKRLKSLETLKDKNIDSIWNKLEDYIRQKGYKLITKKEEFINSRMQIKYICPKHGEQDSTYQNLINNHCGCIKCAYEEKTNKNRNSIEKVKSIIESEFNNVWVNPNEYENAHKRNLVILCGCCGKNTFTTNFVNYKHGQKRCSFCSSSMSIYEKYIYDYLSELELNFIFQKTFPNLKDKKYLIFDFYLQDYNLCIEYDGEQHYNSHFYETMPKNPLSTFENTIKHDKMKTEYCIKNNINLLRIPYTQDKHIKEIIQNKLKEIGKRNSLVS